MEEVIKRIDIIPAVFLRYREDGNVLLRCLQGEDTVDRAFEPRLFKDMGELRHILLGIMTGKNMMRLTVCDGNEWEDLYIEKWSALYKLVDD